MIREGDSGDSSKKRDDRTVIRRVIRVIRKGDSAGDSTKNAMTEGDSTIRLAFANSAADRETF